MYYFDNNRSRRRDIAHKENSPCALMLIISFAFLTIFAEAFATTTSVKLEFLGNLNLGGKARAIALKDNLAYIALNYDGLAIADISEPRQPRLMQHLREGLSPLYLAIEGDICFEGDRERGLQIVDLREPLAPRIVEKILSPPMVLFICPAENYVYLACGSDGLIVLRRFPQPVYLRTVASFRQVDFSKMITVGGKTLYLADTHEQGLKIFDVGNPSSPTLVGAYSVGGFCDVLALKEDILFVSQRRAGVIIADVSKPQSPRVIGQIRRLNNTIKDLKVRGNLLFTANNENGVEVFDVSEPAQPRALAGIKTKDKAVSITLKGDLLLVADWTGGLTVLRLVETN